MSVIQRLPRFIWHMLHFLPPRLAYSLGLGSIVGHFILILTTIGRKSGLPRKTPLLYDEIDGIIYVGSARGKESDWYQNLRVNPNVDIEIGSHSFGGCATLITDTTQVADFLEERIKRHPFITTMVMRVEGIGFNPSREQLEEYVTNRTYVAITRDDRNLEINT